MRSDRAELVSQCLEIAKQYANMDLKLTVRQLYYQLVSRDLLENGQNFYRKVVSATSVARLNGTFPVDLLEDRGRSVTKISGDGQFDVDWAYNELGEYIKGAPSRYIYAQPWFGQANLVSVWVEKEALVGVFESPCKQAGAGLFACKGYPSLSSLWSWCRQVDRLLSISKLEDAAEALRLGNGGQYEIIHILYFGDHDPDGLEIPKVAERQLGTLLDVHGHKLRNSFPPIEFHRVALTKQQIDQYSPPPFPAKQTSSRYNKYVELTGLDDAWELDALPPDILQRLILARVSDLWDAATHREFLDYAVEQRAELRSMVTEEWLTDLLEE